MMNALKAWLRSLTVALGAPALCWVLYSILQVIFQGILIGELESFVLIMLFSIGMTVGVHFIAYLITGLPIFLIYHRHPGEMIWHPAVALTTGTVLGGLCFLVVLATFKGPVEDMLLGAAYGLFTAIAAWLQRPRHHENTHHLP